MDSADLPVACPAEGCDGGPYDTVAALRGHTNARSGPDHPSWQQVQQRIEEQHDQGESGDGAESDTSEDADDDTDEMPTQQEYAEQHDQGESGDGSGDGDQGDQGSDTSGGVPAALPMDPTTLGMLLGTALVLWLAYRALSGDSSDTEGIDQGELGDGSETDTSDETQALGGGLQ
jgi:hypothetical protein